jgi:cytochrome c-type biogenesis protein
MTIVLARSVAALIVVLPLCVAGVEAEQASAPVAQNHVTHTTHPVSMAPPDAAASYDFTLNVDVSDTAIRPSVVFIPAGRPVQLVLRNRGSAEHHYRVIGLAPDELSWISNEDNDRVVGAANENHDHHKRQLVTWRATSPAGIRPTGNEVHAYVSAARRIDVVLFTARTTGTFLVRCDLHREKTGRLVVFDAATPSMAATSAHRRRALTLALSKDLGTVDYPGAAVVQVEATYAPAEYVSQVLGGPAAVAAFEPDRYVAILLTERIHTANLPALVPPPDLLVDRSRVSLIDRKVVTESAHHRATLYRFARDDTFGTGHQVMTLRLVSGQEATWHLPLVVPDADNARMASGVGEQWGLILALLGGMLAAMWPCLFQLTVYFIPALAGVAMQDAGGSPNAGRRGQILIAAFFFILGFTLVYTATGALIGYAAQQLGDAAQFEIWQRYIGIAAGIVVIGLALRVAAKVRAPLVCRMPVLSSIARSKKPATRLEMMVAGLAFATGCMTCFGSALVVGMVVYVGLAQSAIYGALVLFLFSLGMGVPLVIAAVAIAKALPLLLKLEKAVPWMGLVSAVLMAGFGVLLLSGNYMVVSQWTFRVMSGSASLPGTASRILLTGAIAATVAFVAWLIWKTASGGRTRSSSRMNLGTPQ